MKHSILFFFTFLFFSVQAVAQDKGNAVKKEKHRTHKSKQKETNLDTPEIKQELIALSKTKWQLMADKNVEALTKLFDDKSVFVHMGGSWGKEQEINIIKGGMIHYKKADIQEVSVNIIDKTAILLNKITLLAVVGGNEVTNPFMVTEVYIKKDGEWKMGSLSFTKLLTP